MIARGEKSHEYSMLRWLLLPTVFVFLQWSLLISPAAVLDLVPQLWETAPENASKALRLPLTRVQAFDLGVHAARYDECMRQNTSDTCTDHLVAARGAIGLPQLAPNQLMPSVLRISLKLEDEDRSVVQRILGFFNFVNLVWLASIIGVVSTVVPFVIYIVGETLAKVLVELYNKLVVPMHQIGVFEVAAYALSFLFSAQSCRYPVQHAAAAALVGLTGAMGFLPCWSYSTALWATKTPGREEQFMALTGSLLALALMPLAVVHTSSLIGFFAVVAVYTACGFIMGPCLGGFYIGFRSLDVLWRCLYLSAGFVVIFAALRSNGVPDATLAPFAFGARVLGNIGYFLALLILSSKWRSDGNYVIMNTVMLVSLIAAAFVGSVVALPSYTNTAATFFVLWVMEKEMEIKWGSGWIAVLFVNFVALYFLAHHLHIHPEIITSLFDPWA